jgi:hypothetical protein
VRVEPSVTDVYHDGAAVDAGCNMRGQVKHTNHGEQEQNLPNLGRSLNVSCGWVNGGSWVTFGLAALVSPSGLQNRVVRQDFDLVTSYLAVR